MTGPKGKAIYSPIKDLKQFVPSYNANDRTRTFLKVQDGCDYFCSFCTIPLARGSQPQRHHRRDGGTG
jgi:threonylcarbamoyladenosine tRNA methylthiotransferase MtaB